MKRGKLSEDFVNSDSDYEESSSQEPVNTQESKESKPKSSTNAPASNSDESVFELSGKRRVTVRKFRSSVLIDIREYYEDKASGEERPGKKGISLTKEQFEKLKELLPEIDAVVKNMK